MVQEKVTRQELREMHIGQTRIFTLADRKKIASARVTATQMKNEEGLEFDVRQDWESSSVCIKRVK
jgi:hypothetical protein